MNIYYLSFRQVGSIRVVFFVVLAHLGAWCVPSATAWESFRAATSDGEKKEASDVKDKAGLFDLDTVRRACEELGRIERSTHVATLIQTVESLGGQKLEDAALRLARQSEIHGVFILIAKNEKEIELLVSKRYLAILTGTRQAAIRAGFIEGFKKGDFNEGLRRGAAAIGEQLAAALGEEAVPRANASSAAPGAMPAVPLSASKGSPLVIRDQIRLSLAGARAIIAGAENKAAEMKLKINVAAVDDGGHLLAFERMDGARPASLYTAITKATSAATFRQPTRPLAAGNTPADPLLNLSLQNAASASGGKVTTLLGGVPVIVDGQVIGAVGVAGGTGEQDAQVARAGIHAFSDQLPKAEEPAKAARPAEKPN